MNSTNSDMVFQNGIKKSHIGKVDSLSNNTTLFSGLNVWESLHSFIS